MKLLEAAQAVIEAWDGDDQHELSDLSDGLWRAIIDLRAAVDDSTAGGRGAAIKGWDGK